MPEIPLHPSIVHLPLALAVLMPLLAGALLLCWWRGWLPRRTWLIAAVLQLVLVASAFAALRTGEADEERVEGILASEAGLEAHEEAAELFFWAGTGVLLLMIAGAALRSEAMGRSAAAAGTAGALLVLVLGLRVGHAGGELVYRDGAAAAYAGDAAATPPDTAPDEDSDSDE